MEGHGHGSLDLQCVHLRMFNFQVPVTKELKSDFRRRTWRKRLVGGPGYENMGITTFFCLISVGYHLDLRIAMTFY